MKGENKEYQNNKRLYLLGLCGILAVSGTVYAVTRKSEPAKEQKELVDLNDEGKGLPDGAEELAKNNDATPVPLGPTNEPGGAKPTVPDGKGQVASEPTKAPDQLTASGKDTNQPTPAVSPEATKAPVPTTVQTASNDKTDTPKQTGGTSVAEQKPTPKPEKPAETVAKSDEGEEKPQETAQVNNPTAQELRFSEEDGLGWPLSGNVVKNYSVDKLVYFETLGQFKTNPCIFIAGEKGSEIVAAADGIVTEIKKEDKTGQTLLLDIGDGYMLTYGQLSDITVKEGDYVAAGQVLAKLATVTKYYRMEGEHLYFRVQKDGEDVNPMTLIRGNEQE